MKKITRKITSAITAMTILLTMSVTANATSPHIISNVSNTAVSRNLSSGPLPSSLNTLEAGKSYHFNLATDTSNKFAKTYLFVKKSGESNYSNVATFSPKGYIRYCDAWVNAGNSGSLKYYWKVKYKDNGKTEEFRVRTITVTRSSNNGSYNNNSSNISPKVASALAAVKSKTGSAIDYDGAYGPQCVDPVKYFYKKLGVNPVNGNGKDYTWNKLPSGWSRIKGCNNPQPGDILVYTNGKFGHVGIYVSDNESYHQNYNNVKKVQRISTKYNKISSYWGVIRPSA